MPAKLAFVHTLAALVDYFDRLAREAIPGVGRLHTLDEPLLVRIMGRGHTIPEDTARLASHVRSAGQTGADAVLVTCSSLSPCVDEVRSSSTVPVLKIDEAMFAEAVKLGTRIGILATNSATMRPTRNGLLAAAAETGGELSTEESVLTDAFDARQAGDHQRHYRLIARAAEELAPRCDAVILAQASMAPAAGLLSPDSRGKVLTSPDTAMRAVARVLTQAP